MKLIAYVGVAALVAAALALAVITLYIWATDSPVRHDDA